MILMYDNNHYTYKQNITAYKANPNILAEIIQMERINKQIKVDKESINNPNIG